MMMCRAMIGAFEFSREKSTNAFVLFYNICLLGDIQKMRLDQLAGLSIGNVQDLGSSPRSPTPFTLFFI